MQNDHKILTETVPHSKKKYGKPRLEILGDLRTLTLGGSPGFEESGGRNPLPTPKPGYPIQPGIPFPPTPPPPE